jgi:signal transduction histidine kinase
VEARAATIMHYLGDISHDIKNLMTPAQTGAQTLESIFEGAFEDLDRVCSAFSDHPLPTQVAKSCESLRQLFPEMIGMVTESIDAAQERVREIADALKGVIAEPVFEEGNVNEIILTVVKTLKGVAERRGVRLVAEDLGDVPEIPLDRKRLYSAIYNLTNNAIPETPEGGIIALRSDYAADGIFPEGEYVRVQVTDTGKGMTDEVKARLFTEHAISTKPGGTGLGTRIVKNVMDAHGGTVEVESCLGQGTTFTLKLPIRHESGLSTTHQM